MSDERLAELKESQREHFLCLDDAEGDELLAEIERLRRIEAAAKDIDAHCGGLGHVSDDRFVRVRADYIKRLQAALAAKE